MSITTDCSQRNPRASHLIRLAIALLFSLVSGLTLWAGVWAKRAAPSIPRASSTFVRPSAETPIPSPSPGIVEQTITSPPESLSPASAEIFAPTAAQETQAYINFDNVPSGTPISNQYAPAVFSTEFGYYTFASNDFYYGSSWPNHLDRGPITSIDTGGFHPLFVNFTSPVNSLRFYLLAVDNYSSSVAQLKIYQNHQLTATRPLPGYGNSFSPILVNVGVAGGGMGYDNVTRIEIVNITDARGLSFDDFSFTIAAATPTPTPTPTPNPSPTPFPPTNLIAEGSRANVSMVWDSASGASSYNVKRRTTIDPWTTIASGVVPTPTASGFWNRYVDENTIPDTQYYYAVVAVNANGQSVDSNVAQAMLVPSCGDYIQPRPPLETIPNLSGTGWGLKASVSDRDGLVLTDVSLNGRYLAKMMSVPYFYIKTNKMQGSQRGELKPLGDDPTLRSHLYRYYAPSNRPGTTHLVAEYAIDHITPTSKSCLLIKQEYELNPWHPGDRCEPTANLPCARLYPKVSYKFYGRSGETLEWINIPQRLHFQVNGVAANTAAVLRDCDLPAIGGGMGFGCQLGHVTFENKENPLLTEILETVVSKGRDMRRWDNYHQTSLDRVEEPLDPPVLAPFGCPECAHSHWRWSAVLDRWYLGAFGYGYPIVGNRADYLPTDQDLEIGVVRYKPGEEHPQHFASIISKSESIRTYATRYLAPTPRFPTRVIQILGPIDVVQWYSATGYDPDGDLFFKHGIFFNPNTSIGTIVANSSNNAVTYEPASQNGIRAITYGHVYKEGPTTFSTVDPNTLAPLPAGYVPLDNLAYKISTEATVSGPHIVSFDAPSINDQAAFNELAMFHLERDPFDPDNLIWIDDTIVAPDSPSMDFENRIIYARVNAIGLFAIGKLVQPRPDLGSSDLSITTEASSPSVVVEGELSYTLHITNTGPQTATGAGVVDVIPVETGFVSSSPSQGLCKFQEGSVYCKLGTLASGASCDVIIAVKTRESATGVTAQGTSMINTAVVAAENDDANLNNNSFVQTTTLLPNPNARPVLSIISPAAGATYTNPANVIVRASASDPDGSIVNVQFYDGATLIGNGSPTGVANQYQISFSASVGMHNLLVAATDNGGRSNMSEPLPIVVNGSAGVAITSPAPNTIFDPAASIAVSANVSGSISKIEFFANSMFLGEGVGGGNPYSVTWNNVPIGTHALTAVVTDVSGGTTTSAPVSVSVTSRPTIAILSPIDGSSLSSPSRISIVARAQDTDGFVSKVDFYANGVLLGPGTVSGVDLYSFDWIEFGNSVYSLTAVATDNLGVSTTSAPITIGVNTPSSGPGEFIWFDDALPPGSVKYADGDVDWYWVDANPGAFSGTKSHQSRSFWQSGFHQHFFDSATTTLPVNAGDKLFTYVFLDGNNLPREIMLQWKDANNWEHRAYWGANTIDAGIDGTNSRRYMGPLPVAGQWVRLEVPASAVGLEAATLNGMAFSLDGGRASFDLAGKTTANAPPPPTTPPGDFVWIEDELPAGAIPAVVDDSWNWVSNPHYSGERAHLTFFASDSGRKLRSHSFTGAQTPMLVNPGDVLFTYVYLGDPDTTHPANVPDQIMLQWDDGTSWEHRAFWGVNYIGTRIPNMGVLGTENQRYMGGLPAARGWYRLEVPASYVGLEGKAVRGMAFTSYRDQNNPFVAWDRSGKSAALTSVPVPLSSTTGVFRSSSSNHGYTFETPNVAPAGFTLGNVAFYANPKPAPGTVPFNRFLNSAANERFYSRFSNHSGWVPAGVAFHVFPDANTPGTVPLYLYHNGLTQYFLTLDQNEAVGMTFDNIWAYVYPNLPAPPTSLTVTDCVLNWTDSSGNETGFKIDNRPAGPYRPASQWVEVASVAANVTSFTLPIKCKTPASGYRVRAYNSTGSSAYSNEVWTGPYLKDSDFGSDNSAPYVNIISPANGDIVNHNFAITANAFDIDGNGTIVKVEFLANGTKLGEVTTAPHIFPWNNVPSGTYSLTVVVTDDAGATTTSAPVNVIVDVPPEVSITSPASGTVFNAPATISINATAFDGDGSISKVEFFQDSIKLGEDVNAPYNFDWSNVAAGSYSLTAIATDDLGGTTPSSPVNITVNAPPAVSITSPANWTVFTAPAAVTLDANASDADGTVDRVDFYQGATLLGTDTTSPYNFTWTNVSAGSYSITAKATDNLGGVTTSTLISIIVNAPPSISIASPTSGTTFVAPINIAITAVASDDGTINKFEYFQNGTFIGIGTRTGSFTWNNVVAGIYSLTARATDNLGATTTSSSINITVVPSDTSNKIAFASNRDGIAQIYSMNADGSNVSRVTTNDANDESPKWSPNNSRIVFQSDRDNPFCDVFDVYSMNSDGSGQTRLTTDLNDDRAPVWSPDGTKIAFQSRRNGVSYQIYVMNADGSGQVNISNSNANDTQPSWSPDGTRIAFASDRDQPGFPSIYVMNADGSNQTRLTFSISGFLDEQPAWSPDGTKLAFTSTRDSTVDTWEEWILREGVVNKEIYVMNADGSSQTRLTNTMGNDDSPAWLPDGTKIAFRSDRNRSCCDPYEQVWVMNADGSNQVNLSNNQFGDYCPSWSR